MCSNNDTIINDLSSLTHEDLIESYEKLADSYRLLKSENDDQKQKIHFQTQEIRTLSMVQNDFYEMQAEIESTNEMHRMDVEDIMRKNSSQIDDMRRLLNELEADKSQLDETIVQLQKQLNEKDSVIESLKVNVMAKSKPRQSFSQEYQMRIEQLTQELLEVKSQFAKTQRALDKKNHQVEEMTEEISCMKANLESKKTEIDEKNDLIDNLQEKSQEMTMELSALKTAPADDKRKGNSLFAEVDDQRKIMKEVLQHERFNYIEIKKMLNFKEFEIRRLKRENQNIKNEIQACSTLLMRSEKINSEAFKSHVNQLEKSVKQLECELKETLEKLVDVAKGRNLGWIDSIITDNEENQRESRERLMKAMMDNSLLSDNLLNVQRDLVTARMKSVQLRTFFNRILERKSIKVIESDYEGLGIDSALIDSLKFDEIENDENSSGNSSELTFAEDVKANSTIKKEIVEYSPPKKPLTSTENIPKQPSPTVNTSTHNKSEQKLEITKVQPISALKRVPVVVKRTVIPSRKK